MRTKRIAAAAVCASALTPVIAISSSSPASGGDVITCRYPTPTSVGLSASLASDPVKAAANAIGNKSRNRLWQNATSVGFLTSSTKFASKKLLNQAIAKITAAIKDNPGLSLKYKTVRGIRIAVVTGKDKGGATSFATFATSGLGMSEAQLRASSSISGSVAAKVAIQNAQVVKACSLPRSTAVGPMGHS